MAVSRIVLIIVIFTNICFSTILFAAESNEPAVIATQPRRSSIPNLKTASFVLKNGTAVNGKVVSEDRNQITMAEIKNSEIIISAYNRNDIDLRTTVYTTISELKYWLDAADYFFGRTWDFRDDPDDFAQALRCYQKALDLVSASAGEEHELAKQIQAKIEEVTASREKWIAEASTRAEMKKLELESSYEQKMTDLKAIVEENTKKTEELQKTYAQSLQNIEKNIYEVKLTMSQNIIKLENRIEINERDIRDVRYNYERYGRHEGFYIIPQKPIPPKPVSPRLQPQP